MKKLIRETLDWFTDYSGIQFTEVSDSTSTYGDLRFHLQDFDAWLGSGFDGYTAGGFAYYPLGDQVLGYAGETSWLRGGDIFLRADYELGGVYSESTIAHEIGHAVGLSHPFEGYNIVGSQADSVDNSLTLMTYDRAPPQLGINPLPADILALEFIYGGSNTANLGITTIT